MMDRSDWLSPLHAHGVTRKETDGVHIVLSCEHTFQCHIRYWGSRARVEGTCTNTTTDTALCINSRNVGSGTACGVIPSLLELTMWH